ncbi:MAG TPA: type IV pilus modification protein PilV [Burkholderiales bacterium]|nr:type IV pilus modification protein PilV [Burkholderiales bacterium]
MLRPFHLHCVPKPRFQEGVTMLEVLVAILILSIGLLGTASLQSTSQAATIEAYQRAQAIVLLQSMVDRINANRKNAEEYVTASPLGTGSAVDCTAPATIAQRDQCEWNDDLLGSSETKSGGAVRLGAMIDARGCISNPVSTMPREVVVAVVWQGLQATAAPGGTTCGQGAYGTDDRYRRGIVARITIGCLQNDPATGLCVTP